MSFHASPSRILSIAVLLAMTLTPSICPAKEPPPEREVRFTVFGFFRIPNLALADPGGELLPIRFFSNSVSPYHHYRGFSPLRFYHLNGTGGQVVDETSLPVAQLNFEPLGEELLLLFVPRSRENAKGERTYGIFPINLDQSSFPAGSLMVFNALGKPIYGAVGSERFQVRTGPSPVFRVNRQAQVQVATEFEERSAVIYRGPIEIASTERGILFLLPPFVQGSIEAQYRLVRIPPDEDFPESTP